jgi:histidyl-tRNA synthetase
MSTPKFAPPKGTRDFLPAEMRVRNHVFSTLREVFEAFGYGELDTPAFENLELLTAKGGATISDEIYSFTDKGGRDLALRFEFTASLARVLASHAELPRPFKRFQIGKVWRYERPQAGRYREFFQADADIIGSHSLECEIELFSLIGTALKRFGLADYTLMVFDRRVLDGLMALAAIDAAKTTDAFRALDKLHKIGKDGVRAEFAERGLPPEGFDTLIGVLDRAEAQSGNAERLGSLLDAFAHANLDDPRGKLATLALTELGQIVAASEANPLLAGRLTIDPTLVRGLDYYTGAVFEAKAQTAAGIGSFAGGGRYNGLVKLFGGADEPAVGFAFGVERLADVLKERQTLSGISSAPADVYVAVVAPEARSFARSVAASLRGHGLRVQVDLTEKGVGKQFQTAEKMGIPHVVPVGPDEAAIGTVDVLPVKTLATGEQRHLSVADLVALVNG